MRQGKPVLLPGANDARLALAENEVLKVDVGGDLVAGGDQAQLPDDHARLQSNTKMRFSKLMSEETLLLVGTRPTAG